MSLGTAQAPLGSQPIPQLAEPFEPKPMKSATDATSLRSTSEPDDKKSKKRTLFGFGKKKTAEDSSKQQQKQLSKSDPATSTPSTNTTTPKRIQRNPSSPARALSSSPRLASPAGSQIFERDVQESTHNIPNSPAIPSHIQTENFIPPVLDASSEAITDRELDPDSVEIVTSTVHQPAAVTVGSSVGGGLSLSSGMSGSLASPSSDAGGVNWTDELAAFEEKTVPRQPLDGASNYGSLDTTDIRRLSFISFADVVQSEQQQQAGAGLGGAPGSRDSLHHLAGLTSLASVGLANRSPSPVRSPVSSSGGAGPGTSPPTSKSGSVQGLELSPSRKPVDRPTVSPTISGDLAIETMSQALLRTGSGDMGTVRSLPTSPI